MSTYEKNNNFVQELPEQPETCRYGDNELYCAGIEESSCVTDKVILDCCLTCTKSAQQTTDSLNASTAMPKPNSTNPNATPTEVSHLYSSFSITFSEQ